MLKDKFYIIDYTYGEAQFKTRFYRWDEQQDEAEKFCESIKEKGGAVNIRIREIYAPN